MAPCFSHSEALKNFFCIELLENIHGNLKFLILEASITQLLVQPENITSALVLGKL